MNIIEGILLTDDEANALPAWLNDTNCSLEMIASTGLPSPDFAPEHAWRLHIIPHVGMQFEHSRYIIFVNAEVGYRSDVCTITAVRQGVVYYRNESGYKTKQDLAKIHESVKRWVA